MRVSPIWLIVGGGLVVCVEVECTRAELHSFPKPCSPGSQERLRSQLVEPKIKISKKAHETIFRLLALNPSPHGTP